MELALTDSYNTDVWYHGLWEASNNVHSPNHTRYGHAHTINSYYILQHTLVLAI